MTSARGLRVSDAERQAAAARIGAAWAEGRLDDAEYDRRLAQAFAAVTYGDLDQLFGDLPGPRPVVPPPAPPPAYRPLPGVPAPGYGWGPAGQVRPTALQVLLFVVTFGIWGYVYFFQTHDELKRHGGDGIGGVLALLLAVVFWMASPFVLSHEVGRLYERRGGRKPVSARTGLWFFPGIFLLVGPLVWFVLTNRALNGYWRSVGAR
ncbi:DUF1707 domain-containing protein [Blastococcus tunisiensis]|uniref:Uncharacterized protein n=1 Tax=Blastococcus tunisiensis TaxID=1798228 RepID=A0A1I2B0F4_9ACTN|nr:DUF1707 domain-containing protein [Blastococcus sp. DSM 46838]SFE49487.1 protein of unknown function [Blastococcus sp. DSM 46838]